MDTTIRRRSLWISLILHRPLPVWKNCSLGNGGKVRVSEPRPQLFASNKNKKWTG
jgi:hypothetical protein